MTSSLSRCCSLPTARPPTTVSPTPAPPFFSLTRMLCSILLFVLYAIITILCVHLYRRWAQGENTTTTQHIHVSKPSHFLETFCVLHVSPNMKRAVFLHRKLLV